MKKEKREPMTHLLTPRYKGMSAFVTHAPDNVCSCTMSFVTDHGEVNASTGKIEGGVKCSKGLTDPGRIIPDLHSVFKGGLKCFVKIHTLELHSDAKLVEQGQELDEAGAKKIRQQLIEDQVVALASRVAFYVASRVAWKHGSAGRYSCGHGFHGATAVDVTYF